MALHSLRFCLVWLVLLLWVMAPIRIEASELPVPAAPDGTTLVSLEGVRGLLEAYLLTRTDVLPATARVGFKSIEQIRPFVLPAGAATCEITPSDPAVIGSRRFSLIFRVDGKVQVNLALRVELEAMAPVAVVTNDLPRGAVITPKDVRLDERDISTLREPYLEMESLLGKGTLRALKAGEVLHKGLLVTLPVVHRGEQVTLTVRGTGLLLTASGVALGNGGLGEVIRVRNNSSQKEVSGRVVGPGKVDVEM